MRNFTRYGVLLGLLGLACDGRLSEQGLAPASKGAGGSLAAGVGGTFSVAVNAVSTGGAIVSTLSQSYSPEAPGYARPCVDALLAQLTESAAGAPNAANGDPATELELGSEAAAGASSQLVTIANASTPTDLGLGSGDLTVLVIMDQSGSMGSSWFERTKWQVASDSLMKALDPVLDALTIGTIFFPQPNDCDVEPIEGSRQIDFMSGRDFRTRWENTYSSRGPNGSTPLGLALQMADIALEKACPLGLLGRRFRVLIVTDGEPNCGVDVATLPILPAQWRRLGIETRVMGLPGSQSAIDLMNRIADVGGSGPSITLETPEQMDTEMAAVVM